MKRKVLILYTELAVYTLACLNEFCNRYQNTEVFLVRWPLNKEAPFDFSFNDSIKIFERKDYNRDGLKALAKEINPDAILCSGWMDKDYVSVCKEWNKKIPVILAMDNKWKGTLKQKFATVYSRFSILKYFRFVWVPGSAQKSYAAKLGFPEKNIRTGFYSADTSFFNSQYQESKIEKNKKFPHRFIFAGRYYDFKGVQELWSAFIRFKAKQYNDWELWCLGTGDVAPIEHPSIKHFGFVQPEEMTKLMKQCGVFILPSRVEPWGVVVHEFATAGFPLLLSDQVGATEAFLENGKNGFIFPANDISEIENSLEKIASCSDDQLILMGEKSNEMANLITPYKWADIFFELINLK
jgi:glycosyltransferase involved in cell wall biosynthesis